MSIGRGMDKADVVHIHSGLLATKKKKKKPFVATQMNLEIAILSEVPERSQRKTNT